MGKLTCLRQRQFFNKAFAVGLNNSESGWLKGSAPVFAVGKGILLKSFVVLISL